MNAETQTPEVVEAFSALDAAREALSFATHVRDLNVNGLRRFAYKHKMTRKQVRGYWRVRQEADYMSLIRAELAHDCALREFRRVAMIAALTRVIDTDRRINAGQPVAA